MKCMNCGKGITRPYPGADYWRHFSGSPTFGMVHCIIDEKVGGPDGTLQAQPGKTGDE